MSESIKKQIPGNLKLDMLPARYLFFLSFHYYLLFTHVHSAMQLSGIS